MNFELHPRLAGDTAFIKDWPVSRLLVMDDARFPGIILVPRRPNIVEFFDLEPADRVMLCEEMAMAGERLKALTACDKVNIAMLGNIVSQLHVHVVARYRDDAAWPGPIWGCGERLVYDPAALDDFRSRLVNAF
ncbi:MAG: HIT domain-containing protein [Alphaproteobacteria bacterium]|nr:HIT domain-containing protein [Alphaproteobacteria bacterium]